MLQKQKSFLKGSLISFLLVALSFSSFVFAQGTEEKKVWRTEDAYVSSGLADARILIPFLADDITSSSVSSMIYNGLTKVDKDLNVIPDLAEKWEVSSDGKVITFYLRRNVKWHDGEPFTSRDVQFTYDTILDPKAGCPYSASYRDISEITVLDDYTIRFDYKRPYAPALLKFGMGIIPEHIFKNVSDIRKSPYAREPVGTGPYKFSLWKGGRYIILEANMDYFLHPPGIGKYVYRIIPDQSVQFLELVTEGTDSMDLNPYQYIYRSNTPEFSERINKYKYLSHSYTYIGYNLKSPLLSDKRVRQALSYAINKKEIIKSVLLGQGEACTGPFLKGTPFYDEGAEGYEYDPVKAAKLLREAGWADVEKEGVLKKGSLEFRIKIVTNQGNQIREDVATVIQSQWAKFGIKADIQVMAWSAFLDQFIDKKNFQVAILGWTIPSDPDIYNVWHSSSSREGGLNFVSYIDPEVDRLIEKGREEFDPEKRKVIYNELHRRIAEDAPYTFLFFPYATPAINKRIKGIEPAPAGIGYNFIDWYVPQDEVKYKF